MKPYRIHPMDPGEGVYPDSHYIKVAQAMVDRLSKNYHDAFAMEILGDAMTILRGRILTRLYGEYDPSKFPPPL